MLTENRADTLTQVASKFADISLAYVCGSPTYSTQSPSGYSTHIRELCNSFEVNGAKTSIYLSENILKRQHRIPNIFRTFIKKLLPQIIWNTLADCSRLISDERFNRRLANTIKHSPDILYERLDYSGSVTKKVRNSFRGLYVLEIHGPLEEDVNLTAGVRPLQNIFNQNVRRCLGEADIIIAVSSVVRDWLIGKGISTERIFVITNGVNLEEFDPAKFPQKKPRAENEPVIVGFVGSDLKWHHLDALIEAFSTIPQNINARLTVVGIAQENERLRSLVALHKLEKRIHFTGPIHHSKIPGQISEFDICVMPGSNRYGSPIKLFEYGAMGKAIIAPDEIPVCDIMKHRQDALLVSSGNISQLKDAIVELTLNPNLRNQLASAFMTKVRSQYSWNHVANVILERMLQEKHLPLSLAYIYGSPTCTPETPDGNGTRMRELCNGFKALGFETKIYVPGRASEIIQKAQTKQRSVVKTFVPRFLWETAKDFYRMWLDADFRYRLPSVVQPMPNIIYESLDFSGSITNRLRKKHKGLFILEIQAPLEEDVRLTSGARPLQFFFSWKVRRLLKKPDLFVVVSTVIRDWLGEMGVDKERVLALPNGVNLSAFKNVNHLPQTSEGRKTGGIVIGFVGSDIKWHALDALIEAFAKIHEDVKAELRIVGIADRNPYLQNLVRERGLSDRVKFLGAIHHTKIPEVISEFDICVMPGSNRYGSPVKIFEYGALGKAIIAPNEQPVREVMVDGVDGILIPSADIDALATALKKLIADPALRFKLATSFHDKVWQQYGWTHIAKHIADRINTEMNITT